MPEVEFTEDQRRAIEAVRTWLFFSTDRSLTLGGLAGTGKSFLIGKLLPILAPKKIAVCAYTGKAAYELRRKGVANACTMHRIVYQAQPHCSMCDVDTDVAEICPRCGSSRHVVTHWRRQPLLTADLVIVDEASMLAEHHVEDLEVLAPKVLYVGDHGQLEPIGDDPGIMAEPTLRLEQIHRQAAGSEIIQFAHRLRMGAHPATYMARGDVNVRFGLRGTDLTSYDAILCGYNKTRVDINQRIRKMRGLDGPARVGERLICLQNDSELGVFNGMLAEVTRVRGMNDDFIYVDLENEIGESFPRIPCLRSQFDRERKPKDRVPRGIGLFDFGYAMTCHKCVAGDTLIQTDRGWERIDAVAQSRGRVATVEGVAPYVHLIRRRAGLMLRLDCEQGYSISATPDHKLRTFDGHDWIWRVAEALQVGDFLRLKLGARPPMPSLPVELPPVFKGDVRARTISFPSTMTADLAEFLGLMVADGTRFRSGIRLAKRHRDVVERFAKLGSALFGIEPRWTKIGNTPCAEFCSTLLTEWLRRVGGMEPHQKTIPNAVMQTTPSLRRHFLRGLFEDGTVNIKAGKIDHVEWANVDNALVHVVQTLLLEYGIISTVARWKSTSCLYIYGDGLDLFTDLIGFVSAMKQERLTLPRSARGGLRYRVPVRRADFSSMTVVDQGARREGYISRASARDLGMDAALAYHYVRIKSIGHFSAPSYCLEVPSTGSFLQNRFDGSNSQGSSFARVAVLEQIAPSWTATRWRYTAATRASQQLDYFLAEGAAR